MMMFAPYARASSRGAVARAMSSAGRVLNSGAAQPISQAVPEEVESAETFRAADIEYDLVPSTYAQVDVQRAKFGTLFTDHMFFVEHVVDEGWSRPRISPFQSIPIHPAAPVLHYGLCCFEGMKAYAGEDGRIRLFRPEMNMARLARSVARLELARFDPEELLESIRALIRVDAGWVPRHKAHSLYIRPFAFSTSYTLGVSKSTRSAVSVILSPVGPYFPSGLRPIMLFIDEVNRRAWPGGVGHAKVGANYAPTIAPQVEAAAKWGTPQVVYTFGMPGSNPDDAVFEECGAMNVLFLLEKPGGGRELATSPLKGTILPGVTRDSILTLARGWSDVEVNERDVSIGEISQASKEGRLLEAFGCGTACIVQPVSGFKRADGSVLTTRDVDHPFATRVYDALSDIQYGRVEHPWSQPI